jgi:oligopeptide/dipeptide ABC transporter ATP-binding protein
VTDKLLSVKDLTVVYETKAGPIRAANRVEFEVERGQTLGIVGESGSGKSVTLRAIVGLVRPPGHVLAGSVCLGGKDLLTLPRREMNDIRGKSVAMIFQDPMTSLNPVFTTGNQLMEVLRVRRGLPRSASRALAQELFEKVGIPSPERRLREYPHQLSGGMRQRVMIALALACDPLVLLADEPTTALDATVQDQILVLLRDLQDEYGMSIVLVSHDFGVIAQACDLVAVMYAGSIVEYGPVDDVLDHPRHPYTQALARSVRDLRDHSFRGAPLPTLPGQPPSLSRLNAGCAFAERCGFAIPACLQIEMRLDRALDKHGSACIRSDMLE